MPRPGRPRISTGIHEPKTLALYNTGRALLSARDYDAFSVAELAKGARCSVGAFYVRFRDKDAFLGFVFSESFSFAAQSLAAALVNGDIKAIGNAAKARLAVSLLMDQFADDTFAGVVRASSKLGFSDTNHRIGFDAFRNTTTERFTEWLSQGRAKHDAQIRAALRIILGALTDNVLSKKGASAFQPGVHRSAIVHLLQAAVSGDIKSGGKTDEEMLRKTYGKKIRNQFLRSKNQQAE